MPVEINELVIRATITAEPSAKTVVPDRDNEQKIQQVLDEVLKKINDKEER